jgi:hypothetical protein
MMGKEPTDGVMEMTLPRRMHFFLPLCVLASSRSLSAQLQPQQSDPLARIREAAQGNTQACSATGESLCEQIAPKIVANAEGDSPLGPNLRRLAEAERNDMHIRNADPVEAVWAVSSFRDANVDVHIEKYPAQTTRYNSNTQQGEDVVAEIRGREKPEEWVLLGAQPVGDGNAAASLIEAARDIQLTGIRPRRSIRFVMFVSGEYGHYVQTHRSELDHASAVIILASGTSPVTGVVLNGRRDIEPGLREALQPIYAMGVTHHTYDAPFDRYSLSYLLEGIPTLIMPSSDTGDRHVSSTYSRSIEPQELMELKRNTAIAAVAAFGIAERAELLGHRQTRAEIELLLKTTRLDELMKSRRLWDDWESGRIGRQP